MSEPVSGPPSVATLQARVLTLYAAAAAISIVAIFLLAAYAIRLGALVGPGIESSLGLAVALMMLLAALVVHLVDRVYREWPLGRKYAPETPPAVTDQVVATFLKALVFAGVVGAAAYILSGLFT